MRIDIITVLPELIQGFMQESIVGRAQKKGLVEIHIHNLRDYTMDKWRRVDDYPFGGFAGMVMQCEPIDRCISALTAERHYDQIIFTTPDGEQFDQPMANSLSLCENIIILCGHYKGIDYRMLMQFAVLARSLACCSAGSRIPARIAMIAITTRSSISVNSFLLIGFLRSVADGARHTSAAILRKEENCGFQIYNIPLTLRFCNIIFDAYHPKNDAPKGGR